MPQLVLATGVIAMNDRYAFNENDWHGFLQARILSVKQRETEPPDDILFEETRGVTVDVKRRDEIRGYFKKALAMHVSPSLLAK